MTRGTVLDSRVLKASRARGVNVHIHSLGIAVRAKLVTDRVGVDRLAGSDLALARDEIGERLLREPNAVDGAAERLADVLRPAGVPLLLAPFVEVGEEILGEPERGLSHPTARLTTRA